MAEKVTEQQVRVRDKFSDVVLLLGLEMPEDDLAYALVRKCEQAIKNYCNIDSVPQALEELWSELCVDYLRYSLAAKAAISGSSTSPTTGSTPVMVSSINELDTSVSLTADTNADSVKSSSAHAVENGIDGVLMNYTDQLNRFRRMTWD